LILQCSFSAAINYYYFIEYIEID